MHSVNRIFTLFVVLAAFASVRSFGGEFTPMPTLFDSVGGQQTTSNSSAMPNSPEDIQFPEPANDVDLALIPAPEVEKQEVKSENQATNSIEQVGFYLPEQTPIPAAPRSTLPDPSIYEPNYSYQLIPKPKAVNANSIAAAPQPTSVPADVKAIVEPATNPFAQEPAVGLGSRQEAVGSSNYPLATRNSQLILKSRQWSRSLKGRIRRCSAKTSIISNFERKCWARSTSMPGRPAISR